MQALSVPLIGAARLSAAHAAPATRAGRAASAAFGPKDLAAAKALPADPDIRVEDVAARLKVSPATLYRYLPGGRAGLRALE